MPPQLGIFGGTFDPPHRGHVTAARSACDQLATETLHIVVNNDPWQKSARRSVTAAVHRLAMARLAFGPIPGVEVTDVELARGGASYMIDTVSELERPNTETVLVMGAETAAGLPTWHRADELALRVVIAVIQPAGEPPIRLDGWRSTKVAMEPVEVSATEVRAMLRRLRRNEHEDIGIQAPLDRLVPSAVMEYITNHKLYSP